MAISFSISQFFALGKTKANCAQKKKLRHMGFLCTRIWAHIYTMIARLGYKPFISKFPQYADSHLMSPHIWKRYVHTQKICAPFSHRIVHADKKKNATLQKMQTKNGALQKKQIDSLRCVRHQMWAYFRAKNEKVAYGILTKFYKKCVLQIIAIVFESKSIDQLNNYCSIIQH